MSKHQGRKGRWRAVDPKTHTSALGTVQYRQDAWYAHLVYRVRQPAAVEGELPSWVNHDRWLGPFKRPRNAMVELEREVTVLRNRHGDDVQVGEEIEAL
jgi:hypothetical protein